MTIPDAHRADEPDFAAVLAAHRPALLRAVSRRVGPHAAEDVVQETLIAAYLALRDGHRPPVLGAWLHAVARNAATDAHRRCARRPTEPLREAITASPAGDPHDQAVRRDELHAVLSCVEALPRRQREALLAVALEGRSYDEVASASASTVSAVKALVNRARVTVRRAAASAASTWPLRWGGASIGDQGLAPAGGAASGLLAKLAVAAAVGGGAVAAVHALPAGLPDPNPTPAVVAAGLAAVDDDPPEDAAADPTSSDDSAAADGESDAPDPPDPAARAIIACAGSRPLERFDAATLRRAQHTLPTDVAEYTDCSQRLADAVRDSDGG